MLMTSDILMWLHRSIGQGPINDVPLVIFANEFGAARGRGNTEDSINQFINEFKTRKLLKIGKGFTVVDIDAPPVTSSFLQFVSRLSLAIQYEDDRFFNELSIEGKSFLNDYIMNKLYRKNEAILNFKPLLQPTENHWPYENISESAYYKLYNFTHKNNVTNKYKEIRIEILKEAFNMIKKNAVIVGAGDKENKRVFFETIYPEIKFSETKINDTFKVYHSNNINKKIILSNYFDNRTLDLDNLKDLYFFIKKFQQEECEINVTVKTLF